MNAKVETQKIANSQGNAEEKEQLWKYHNTRHQLAEWLKW
jgi:hypothetical protein